MTSLSSDKWERRPHKNSDVLYRWHWDSLFRFFIFFFVSVKLCHFFSRLPSFSQKMFACLSGKLT
jgi:hypothetical protein